MTRSLSHIISTATILTVFLLPACMSAVEDKDWHSMESNFFTVYYRPGADLDDIEKKLGKRAIPFDQSARYGKTEASEEICRRLDKLFVKAEEMLGAYPDMKKVNIKIFEDANELKAEYIRIFGKRGDFKSFYVEEYSTIYTSESDIDDSVMIHEMAHVIANRSLPEMPPEKLSEILASYVDVHIDK